MVGLSTIGGTAGCFACLLRSLRTSNPENPEEIITGVLPITNGDLYDIAPDGKRFVVAKTDEAPLLPQYRLVVNWIEEVKARAGQRR